MADPFAEDAARGDRQERGRLFTELDAALSCLEEQLGRAPGEISRRLAQVDLGIAQKKLDQLMDLER